MQQKIKWLLLLGCFLMVTFWGCGKGTRSQSQLSKWMEANGKIKILSTTAMIDDIVGEIGKEKIDHLVLIKGQIDPHNYELVKGDSEKFEIADIVFFNGLGLEHGASLQYQLKEHPQSIPLGNILYHKEKGRFLTVNGQIDPHIWMDISLWAEIIEPIVEACASADLAHADFYRKNGEEMKQKMLNAHDALNKMIKRIPSKHRYLVTSHDAFNYFARCYLADQEEENWERRFIAPEGLAPDGQLGTGDIKRVCDYLLSHRIGVVFPEMNLSKDSLKKVVEVCRMKGLTVNIADVSLYGDTMGEEGSFAETYLGMIEHNIKTLCRSLYEREE